jgi:hypothetical protein
MWTKAVITGLTLDVCVFVVLFIWNLTLNRATGAAALRAHVTYGSLTYLFVFLSGFTGYIVVR